tara:strand:+ start:61 stop:1167 length:1107 start_codon:yes stop_codon:yes gene_type:complete
MAISIDRVYQKVLAFANKEQRGYITPQEFNLFAHQAQMEIFEQYFYDINQWTRQHGNSSEHSDMLTNLEEKVSLFEHTTVGDNITVLNKWGDVNLDNDLPDLYRLMNVRVNYPTSRSGYNDAELVNSRKEFHLLSSSKLTKPNVERPLYLRYHSRYNRIKIYPYPVDNDGSNFDLSTQEFANNYIQVKSILNPGPYANNGKYFYFDQQEMIDLLGEEFSSQDIFTISSTSSDGATSKLTNQEVMLFDDSSSNSIGGNAHGRKNTGSADGDWAVGDRIFLGGAPKKLSNKRNVQADYIRKPKSPSWNYVVVSDKALYNSTTSTDFELHDSEESELVYRILAYAGIAMEKPNLTQSAASLEQAKVQQEKQ